MPRQYNENYKSIARSKVWSELDYLLSEQWEDLRFPVQGINLPGAGGDPTRETTTGALLFTHNLTDTIAGVAQLPHSWSEETSIEPHVHWQKTTSDTGDVLWEMEYELVNNGDIASMAYANSLSSSTVAAGTPDDDSANRVLITNLGGIDMTGMRISSLILFKLSRIGGSDSYGEDARLLEFDIHYKTDSRGSLEIFTKTI